MLNFFTLQNKVGTLQKDVLGPLYTVHNLQGKPHKDLLYLTGEQIAKYRIFIEEVFNSTVVWLAFKVVKILGGAASLSEDDFNHFTGYIKAGGLDSMLAMLEADDMFKAFSVELLKLPPEVQADAPYMLKRAQKLHMEFIDAYFKREWGSVDDVCPELIKRQVETNQFIGKLIILAEDRWNQIR